MQENFYPSFCALLGGAEERCVRVAVDVTFLSMSRPPSGPAATLPKAYRLGLCRSPSVSFYRQLYDQVGRDYCWWMRRVLDDWQLAAILSHPRVWLYVLEHDSELAGFAELDGRREGEVNLAYFGLMPGFVGQGVGLGFLSAVIEAAWRRSPCRVRVNTCTADHPRALAMYKRAGFVVERVAHETWDIPGRLELPVPERLRV